MIFCKYNYGLLQIYIHPFIPKVIFISEKGELNIPYRHTWYILWGVSKRTQFEIAIFLILSPSFQNTLCIAYRHLHVHSKHVPICIWWPISFESGWETENKIFMPTLICLLESSTSSIWNIVLDPFTASRHRFIVPKGSDIHSFFFSAALFHAAWQVQQSWSHWVNKVMTVCICRGCIPGENSFLNKMLAWSKFIWKAFISKCRV